MIPVFQTQFYDDEAEAAGRRGNCLSAVVASLLELPLLAVPNFVELDSNGGPDWSMHMRWYLRQFGVWQEHFDPRTPPSGLYTVTGLSPRSFVYGREFHHIAIYRAGRCVHDPVPGANGVMTQMAGWQLCSNDEQIQRKVAA